jgi:hypothetical protein
LLVDLNAALNDLECSNEFITSAALLIEQFVRQGYVEELGKYFVSSVATHSTCPFSSKWSSTLSNIPDPILESLILTTFSLPQSQSLQPNPSALQINSLVKRLCHPLSPSTYHILKGLRALSLPLSVRFAFIHLFHKSLPAPNDALAISDVPHQNHVLFKAFVEWIQLWSSSTFFSSQPKHIIQNLTENLILCCAVFERLPKDENPFTFLQSNPSNPLKITLNEHLYAGVGRFLDSKSEIRVFGQLLAENVTKLLFGKGVNFELEADSDAIRIKSMVNDFESFLSSASEIEINLQRGLNSHGVTAPLKADTISNRGEPRSKPESILHSALCDSDDTDEDISNSYSYISLDQNQLETPIFLRDCLDILRKHGGNGASSNTSTKDVDLLVATITRLPEIIGATPSFELDSLAPLLSSQLLLYCSCPFDEDDSSLVDSFEHARSQALLSLGLRSPVETMMYGDH